MILYHGSNTEINEINFSKCRPFKDFGKGFYLTDIKEQAELMAKRTCVIFGGKPIVTEFEFDLQALKELSVKSFEQPNEEWAKFVLNNRTKTDPIYEHGFDIVIGPVADDAIATLFRNFNDGIIDLPTLVNGLKYKKLSSQYFFHTEQSLNFLHRK